MFVCCRYFTQRDFYNQWISPLIRDHLRNKFDFCLFMISWTDKKSNLLLILYFILSVKYQYNLAGFMDILNYTIDITEGWKQPKRQIPAINVMPIQTM